MPNLDSRPKYFGFETKKLGEGTPAAKLRFPFSLVRKVMWANALLGVIVVMIVVCIWLAFIHTAKVPKEGFGTITKEELLQKADTGDLIFLSGTRYAEKLIKRLTSSCYSHVGMVLKQDGKVWLWEADLGQHHKEGPRLILLSEKLERWSGVKVGGWLSLSPDKARPTPEQVLPILYSLVGKQMDRRMTKWLVAGRPQGWIYGELSDPDKVYCSELVALTMMEMGLLKKDKAASWYSPGSFVDEGRMVTFRF